MDDQLYLRDGEADTNGVYFPEEPEEVKEDRRTEDAIIASSYPIIQDVADWFNASILECDSISNIEVQTMTYNGVKYERSVSVEGQVLAYQLLKELLSDKLKEFGEFGENTS